MAPRRRPDLSKINIAENVEALLKAPDRVRDPASREASFDYCFNHFQTYREEDRVKELATGSTMELSCLHLGFYLASWGMMRGSSELLQRSAKHLEPVIKAIIAAPDESWTTDADSYTDEAIDGLLATADSVREAFDHPTQASDTLVTKVMLGVFGSVPAFDTNFGNSSGMWTLGPGALHKIGEYYDKNREVIDNRQIRTLDFATGKKTGRSYTKARIIDMVFWWEGR